MTPIAILADALDSVQNWKGTYVGDCTQVALKADHVMRHALTEIVNLSITAGSEPARRVYLRLQEIRERARAALASAEAQPEETK